MAIRTVGTVLSSNSRTPPKSGGTPEASISAVAKLASVSVATVSNVLNRPEIVSSTLRHRVEDAVRSLGYVPNAAARSLRRGVTESVGAVFFDISNPFFATVTRHMATMASERGHILTVMSTDQDPDREHMALEFLFQHGVRAIVVTTAMANLDHLSDLQSRGVAVTLLAQASDRAEIGSVTIDDAGGMQMVVEHLLDRGARHFGFLDGPRSARQHILRREAVRHVLTAAGLDLGEALTTVVAPSPDPAGGRVAMAELLRLTNKRIDAVVCINDYTAIGAIQALNDAGLNVPDDVAVTGFDDIDAAALLAVPLTTIRQPLVELGTLAVNSVLDVAQNGTARPEQLLLAPTLMCRPSTAITRRNYEGESR